MFYAIIVTRTVTFMARSIRTLGDVGSNLLTELLRQGKRLFALDDASQVYGNNNGALRRLLYTLIKRRWLQRLEGGTYLILPFEAGREGEWTEHEFIIASYLIKPYYIGFRSALNYYGYTEQVSRTVFIASTRRKLRSALEISGVTYRFVYMSDRKFFGVAQVTLDGYRVNISEPEKTIVDCLGRLEYCGGVVEVAKALCYGGDELDFVKMAEYARRNGNRAAIQRLGFLLEMLDFRCDEAIALLREGISNSYAPLDNLATREGQYIERWKVLLNVSENDLLQWKER
jgi:predicted transcriptional regulator of viral defense system